MGENRMQTANELHDLTVKYAELQKQSFDDRKRFEVEMNLLSEQRELDKEMDQNMIASLRQQLSQHNNNKSNEQMYGQQMVQYQREQYLRQQQWLAYQQQQQRELQQMFPPPPESP